MSHLPRCEVYSLIPQFADLKGKILGFDQFFKLNWFWAPICEVKCLSGAPHPALKPDDRRIGMQVPQAVNVRFWHNARAQLGAFEGTQTTALPTLRAECRFITGFDGRHP